jgi:TetR/AcrR family transcriptional regulator, transcriptional repressor for nem operon
MKVDQQTMAAHRAAILKQAGRLFRQHGIDGVAVADITGAAGLTHGAFYGHFPSKAALAAEACRLSLERSAEHWRRSIAQARRDGLDPLTMIVDDYLTPTKRDQHDRSCAITTLGHEASRDAEVGPAMGSGVEALLSVLEELIAERRPNAGSAAHAEAALAALAAMNGGLTLARLLAAHPKRSAAALKAAAALAKRVAD